jgi:hypothetical protein
VPQVSYHGGCRTIVTDTYVAVLAVLLRGFPSTKQLCQSSSSSGANLGRFYLKANNENVFHVIVIGLPVVGPFLVAHHLERTIRDVITSNLCRIKSPVTSTE